MPNERAVTVTNTGTATISVLLEMRRGEGYRLIDLEPGNSIDAWFGGRAGVALDDAEGVATRGQYLPDL